MGSVHAHRTKGVTRFEEREGANGVGGGKGDENGVRSGSGDVNGDGTGMITGVEANEGTQDENGDGSGNRAGTVTETGVETREGTYIGNGDGIESSSGDGNGKREGERNVDGATKPIGHIKYGTYPVLNPELDVEDDLCH